jgi:rRNA maturation protein Nop10
MSSLILITPIEKISWTYDRSKQKKRARDNGALESFEKAIKFYEDLYEMEERSVVYLACFSQEIREICEAKGIDLMNLEAGVTKQFYTDWSPVKQGSKPPSKEELPVVAIKKEAVKKSNRYEKKTCPHCGRAVSPSNFFRWHGENCAAKKQAELPVDPRNYKNDRITCPHCGKTGRSSNMNRWHFNNCKGKPDDGI